VYTLSDWRNLIKMDAVPNSIPAKAPWIKASLLSLNFCKIVFVTSWRVEIKRYSEVKLVNKIDITPYC